ncbi:MAG: NAD(P)H-dependent glycerol-3-phosphate dehydrogenase [Polyangiales bacterium]
MSGPFGAPIAVLGAGNWGTVLAHLAAQSGHEVRLWSRDPAQCAEINETHINSKGIAALRIDDRVRAEPDLRRAVDGAGMIVVVIPSQAFREVSRKLGDVLDPRQLVVHATKGIELKSHRRMTEILEEETCARQIGVLSGPNIAAEIAEGLPAGTVVTSRFPHVVKAGKQVFTSGRFMVFGASDVVGVELCGALKNVVAIAAGIASGMRIGENAMSLLVTRGLAEITALASAMGARPGTLAGLAGAGDLMVTCRSHHSRNHRVGEALAKGDSLDAAVARLGMVAEGVTTAIAAKELAAEHAIECPVLERVYRVLHEGIAPTIALDELLRMRAGRDVAWA